MKKKLLTMLLVASMVVSSISPAVFAEEIQPETVVEETEIETMLEAEEPEVAEEPVEPVVIAVESISLNKKVYEMTVGDTFQLVATVNPANAEYEGSVAWASDDESVVKVVDGMLTAVGKGEAIITASLSGKRASCIVTVNEYQEPQYATSISLSETSMDLTVGETKKVVATVLPAELTDYEISWTSNDTTVATVDQSGNITGISEGTATITASVDEVSATITVNVSEVTPTSLELNKTSLSLTIGKAYTLVPTVLPEDAVDKEITWSSSNEAVANVSENGEVEGVGTGKATITASLENGLTATCAVTVKLATPTSVKATAVSTSKIKITFGKVKSAAKYTIYRATTKDGKYTSLGSTTSTSYTDATVSVGKTYYYKVRAIASNTSYNSAYSSIVSCKALPAAPVMSKSVTATSSTIAISWSKVSDITGYALYRKTTSGSWTKVATIKSASTVKYTDKVSSGAYDYRIRAYKTVSGKTYYGSYSNVISTRTLGKTNITITKVSGDVTQKILNWTKIGGATGYEIYIRKGDNGSWTLEKKVGKITSYQVTLPTHGVYFYYKIRPIYSTSSATTKGQFGSVSEGWKYYYNPNYTSWMSSTTDSSTYYMFVHVTNNGVGTMRFYSKGAKSRDHDYSTYDRSLTLIDESNLNELSYVEIKPGQSKWLCFMADTATWYDQKTSVYCKLKYDGEFYTVRFSSYYGSQYSRIE